MYCEICKKHFKNLKTHCVKRYDKEHTDYFFNDLNFEEWVPCKIEGCFYKASRIDFHLKTIHKMSKIEYELKYGSVVSKKFIERTTEQGKHANDRKDLTGENNPFYGKKHSKESCEKISQTTIRNNSLLEHHHNLGRIHTEQTRKKMSESRIGEKNPRFGIKPDIKTTHSIHGFRSDIGHSVRSTLEANYARYLRYNNIDYVFEPKSFLINNNGIKQNCWIDFYLTQTDEWVELKNYLGRDITKYELVKIQYTNVKIKIIYADSEEWTAIENKYSSLIPLWETGKQNLRTHPELYK